jgi:phage terminase large subunit-like protein
MMESSQMEEFRLKLAELGKKNLYFLCKGLLGYDRLTPTLHRELCWVVENPAYSKKLVMIPRGHYKSTIGTKGRSLQWVVNDPNERILIVSATTTNAERFLRHIKSHFEQNELFRWVYREIIPQFNKTVWTNKEIIVKRTKAFPEPTMDTAGVGTALPGRHYTKIIKDDIVNDKNVNTPELIDQVIEWDASTIPLFDDPEDPSNEELVIGTPWSNLDVYSLKRKDPDYAVYVRHSLESADGKADYVNGLPIFGERFTRAKLQRIRERLANDELFWCQYMCDPHGGGSAQFKRDYMQYWESLPSPLAISITVDPGGMRPDSDFTAFTVVGVDQLNNWYVIETIKRRMNPREIIETMFELYQRYPETHSIGIESVAYQLALVYFAIEKMRETGVFLPIRELKTDNRVSKEMRIKGLIPRFSNKAVWLKKGASAELEDELFERVRNDDLKDALAYQLQLANVVPSVRLQSIMNPFSIEAILLELKNKNRSLAGAVAQLTDRFYTEPRENQLRR